MSYNDWLQLVKENFITNIRHVHVKEVNFSHAQFESQVQVNHSKLNEHLTIQFYDASGLLLKLVPECLLSAFQSWYYYLEFI